MSLPQLNEKWSQLRDKAEKKKEELESAHSYQTFHIEIRETVSWIEEKTKLLHQTEGLGSDLVCLGSGLDKWAGADTVYSTPTVS